MGIEGWTSLGCEKGDCMNYLAYSMMILFITNLVVGNATEILIPLANQYMKAQAESEGTDGTVKMSVAELQYTLDTYDPTESTIEDFTTISIELGYVVLFAVAFPVAPFMAAMGEYVQIRTDGWKLCRAFKRCEPVGAQDIGIWASIFQLTTYASVISNAGIVMFTGTWFPYKLSTRPSRTHRKTSRCRWSALRSSRSSSSRKQSPTLMLLSSVTTRTSTNSRTRSRTTRGPTSRSTLSRSRALSSSTCRRQRGEDDTYHTCVRAHTHSNTRRMHSHARSHTHEQNLITWQQSIFVDSSAPSLPKPQEMGPWYSSGKWALVLTRHPLHL